MLYFVLQNSSHVRNERINSWGNGYATNSYQINPTTTRYQFSKTQMNKDFKTAHIVTYMDFPVQKKFSYLSINSLMGHILYFDDDGEALGFKLFPEKYFSDNKLSLRAIYEFDQKVLEELTEKTYSHFKIKNDMNKAVSNYDTRFKYLKPTVDSMSVYVSSSFDVLNKYSEIKVDETETTSRIVEISNAFDVLDSDIRKLFDAQIKPISDQYSASKTELLEYLKNTLIYENTDISRIK